MRQMAVLPWLVDAGAIAATLSSALASFLGAPRILQSLAGDRVFPFLDAFAVGHGPMGNPRRGVFATRSQFRPNQLGVTVAHVEKVEANIMTVSGLDAQDGTPVLDIKPYASAFNAVDEERIGWLSERLEKARGIRSDNRFGQQD